jgi:phosphoglycolate phosphatase
MASSTPDSCYSLILFDFDGTLADSFPWFRGAINQLARQHHFKETPDGAVDGLRGLPHAEILQRLGLPLWKVPLVARDMRCLMSEEIDRIRLFPQIEETLMALADGGAALAVVSSNALENVHAVLGEALVRRVVQFECGASLSGKAARLKRVLKRSGFRPAQAVFIGDEIRDIEAAKSAGIAAGAVGWGYNDAESLRSAGPQRFFAEPADLLDLVPPPPQGLA